MRWCNMMKGHCGMVFRSGMSEAHFWRCVCVFVPPLSLLDLNFTAPEPHPSNRKTETTRANLPSLARIILHPTPLFTFPVSCCVCLAAASDNMSSSFFFWARISKVQRISENGLVKMTRGSLPTGMLLFPQTAYQLPWWKVMMMVLLHL